MIGLWRNRVPKVSIITAVYNAEQYLHESLDSVFAQTFTDFELILVDDCSTDNSKEILIKYTDHPNVRLLLNKYNEGCPVSRNRAFLEAKGEYIAIHDADDISLPSRLERQVEYLDKHPKIDFLGSHAIKISQTGAIIGNMVYPPPDTVGAFRVITRYKLNPIIDPSSMSRKKVILENGGYVMTAELRTSPDFHLWCRLLAKGYQLANLQFPLIKYRINPEGVTIKDRNERLEATDLIWASFRRKSFPTIELREDLFQQDSYTEYTKKE